MTCWQIDCKDVSSVQAGSDGKRQPVVETLNIIDTGTGACCSMLMCVPISQRKRLYKRGLARWPSMVDPSAFPWIATPAGWAVLLAVIFLPP
jgi:hypothetical protein